MSEQNRDSLENFFRERAQNYNLEFNEADWQKLEMQLDQELPVAFSFFAFIKKFWLIPVLLLLIPTLWFTLTHIGNEKPNISSQIEKINEGQSKLDYSPADTFAKLDKQESSTSTIKYDQQDLSKLEADKSSQEMNYIESNNEENQNEAFVSAPSGETEEENNKKTDAAVYSVLENGAESDKTEAGNSSQEITYIDSSNEENQNEAFVIVPPGKTEEEYNKKTNVIGYAVLENGAGSDKTESDLMLHFLFPITPEPAINEINSIEIEKGEIIKGNSSKTAKRSELLIGVGYSPDFSTVGIGNFVAPGSRWNIALEYGFSKRFMINTGVVWVQNKYEAYGEDYHFVLKRKLKT